MSLIGLSIAIILVTCSACTENQPSAPSGANSSIEESQTRPDTNLADNHGCPDSVLERAAGRGLNHLTQHDPAKLQIFGLTVPENPDCYLTNEQDGGVRSAAVWVSPSDSTLDAINTSLGEAGYRQSPDYGPYIWWIDGETPSGARQAIEASTEPIDGKVSLWLTW